MSIPDDERYAALQSKCSVQMKGEADIRLGSVNIDLIETLKKVSLLVQKLMTTEGDAFELQVVDKCGNSRLVSSKSGRLLLKIINSHVPTGRTFRSLYQFEPYIEMALNRIVQSGLYGDHLIPRVAIRAEDARRVVQRLNECVDGIRQEGSSQSFKAKLKNYQRSSNKNHKELNGYIVDLFERYSRLLVLRVDLSYSKEHAKTTQAVAKQDRERLFENARSNKLFDDMVGYIWKMEHGSEKGFHYHMMFFFDGSKVREDITLATRIGEYWVDVITKGRGLYYNCNASKWRYENCGIGMVSYGDAELRKGLCKAVVYLTKTDLYMKLQTEGRGMGKGNRPGPKDSRGRPRAAPLSGSA
ncbi:inovirus-type Gp2 protein [Pseudomonas yamanorum]|nr:inovirus-type Gp2 protein [Pseudomonas yamanorum]